MKKIVLTSCGIIDSNLREEFLNLFKKKPENLKVLYIPTAVDGDTDDDLSWVDEELEYVFNLGIKKENITEYRMDYELDVTNYDFIYVMGGNTFYLLKKIKEYGFDKKIKEALDSGVVYVGSSAGSIIMGITIEVSYDENVCGLTDFTGLNFIDGAIIPHANRKKEFILEQAKKYQQIYSIEDKHAVMILDDKVEYL
jgi:dipeptidase E